jgi:hypothetical protein
MWNSADAWCGKNMDMEWHESIDLKNRLTAIYLQKGGAGLFTGLFDKLDPYHANSLLERVARRPDDSPILGGYRDEWSWWLLTTSRLVWQRDSVRSEVVLDDVAGVGTDLHGMSEARRTFSNLGELLVEDRTATRRLLRVEQGSALVGLWYVLSNIALRNRRVSSGQS